MVLVAVWALVILVIALYVLFIVWRLRVDRRKKAVERDNDAALSSAIARAAAAGAPPDRPEPESTAPTPPPRVAARPTTAATPTPAPAPSSTPVAPPPAAAAPAAATTVAEALSGISLPNDLAPLTTMAPRGGTGDRVAFWTMVPAEVVGPAFGDELERLGYTVTSLDEHTLAAQRGDTHLVAVIHPDGHRATIGEQPMFETVPELSVVIEVWIAL